VFGLICNADLLKTCYFRIKTRNEVFFEFRGFTETEDTAEPKMDVCTSTNCGFGCPRKLRREYYSVTI